MENKKLFIPILLGTIRQGRESEKVAQLLFNYIQKKPEIETKLIDPREMHLSITDEGPSLKEQNTEWKDTVTTADGLIIVVPEYNHSFPGSLKSVIDMLLEEYEHKAVGLCGVSSGSLGGTRAVESLLPILRTIKLTTIKTDLYFPQVGKLLDEAGKVADESAYKRIDIFLTELIWMAKTLRWGRENIE